MALIDLGTMTGDEPAPGPPRVSRRMIDPRWRRSVLLVAVALVSMLALTGSAGGLRPALRMVASVAIDPSSRVLVTGDRMYVVSHVPPDTYLTAYRLPGGKRLWRTPIHLPIGSVSINTATGVVAVTVLGNTLAVAATVLDAKTGRELWARDGVAQVLVGDRYSYYVSATGTNDTRLSAVDTWTDHTLWSTTLFLTCQIALVDGGRLAELCPEPDETLEVVDGATGDREAYRSIVTGFARPDGGIALQDEHLLRPHLFSLGDLLLVSHDDYPGPTVDAYAAATLDTAWGHTPITAGAVFNRCGTDVCASDTGRFTVLDGTTGAIVDTGRTASATRLFRSPARDRPGMLVVLAPGQIADPSAVPAGAQARFAQPLAAPVTVPVGSAFTGSTWIVRQTRTGTGPAIHRIGLLTGVGVDSCLGIGGGYVGCETQDFDFDLWRLP